MTTCLIHTFSKREIERQDFRRFDQLFSHWPQLWGMELRNKFDSLVFLNDGYNYHPEEIYCIPEVRNYYQELHKRWPWWAFFLANVEANFSVAYLCLLKSVQSVKRSGEADCAAVFDPSEVLKILMHDFSRMNYLWDIAGMSEEDNEKRTDELIALFAGGLNHG